MVVSFLPLPYFLLVTPLSFFCLSELSAVLSCSSLVYGLRGVDTVTVYGVFLFFNSGVQRDSRECVRTVVAYYIGGNEEQR